MNITSELINELRVSLFRMVRKLKRQNAFLPFSQSELNIIGYLDRNGPLLPSELAEMENVSAQAISQNLNNLIEQNCITKTVSEDDKRKVKISLTEEGRVKLNELRHQREEWLIKAIGETLNAEETGLLLAAIPALRKLADFDDQTN